MAYERVIHSAVDHPNWTRINAGSHVGHIGLGGFVVVGRQGKD
jgi:hypothetical protein